MAGRAPPRWWAHGWLASCALVFALLPWAGCLEPRQDEPSPHATNCTTCHGSPVRSTDDLGDSAPPFDLSGNTDPREPGVGAHLAHLYANDLHAGVACDECHEVPTETSSPGHADTALPAEVIFGSVAKALDRTPLYLDFEHRCADTHCHQDATPSWTDFGAAAPRCEKCHGMPPPPPHPASTECFRCHAEVVDQFAAITAPAKHVNGIVEVEEACDTCHGTGVLGAPPPALDGSLDVTSLGVGAHETHLSGTSRSRAVACEECHEVPESSAAPGHLSDGTPHAEVLFTGIASSFGQVPAWDRVSATCAGSWCHGPQDPMASSPAWTDPTDLGCDTCHGAPPAPPHPQMDDCSLCHGAVVGAAGIITAPERHVDGIVDLAVPALCETCHGDATTAAPPADTLGQTGTEAPGVGAHRAHVEGSGNARPVPCDECHRVPDVVLADGHIDTGLPAELVFSGVALSFGGSPDYDGSSCSNSYCHGDRFVLGHPSGGKATEPIWTLVDGSQAKCDSCHGLPPPPPHPPGPSFCSDCHPNVGITLQILDPLSHVNGKVDLMP